jgi:hypothetical protein
LLSPKSQSQQADGHAAPVLKILPDRAAFWALETVASTPAYKITWSSHQLAVAACRLAGCNMQQ